MSVVWEAHGHDVRRVLGAIECVDGSTGARIAEPLQLQAPGARFVRNVSGLYALVSWTPLASHADAFAAPPATPAVGSQALDVRITDPAGHYVPRDARMLLPRDPNPLNAASPDSLFRPQRVPMMRSATAPPGHNWSTLFVNVSAGNGDALGGALIEVFNASAQLIARGVSDWRGECVLPVVGIPVTTWGDGEDAVVVDQVPATVRVRWPAVAGTRVAQDLVAAGRPPARLPIIDPDNLPVVPTPIAGTPVDIQLTAGRAQSLRVVLTVP
ncbi:hypothetical protein WKW79_01155 [Variovorax robiniae]|uniref:Uncharacterized protein n=1 Tax=Variovorax robiniae TaxID=1836199 RepID=A0ABU8X0K6_9BURK